MNINVLTKKYAADIDYVDAKNITLKSGAKLGNESPSLDPALKNIRAANTTTDASGNLITTCDLVFKSASAIASFIVGSPQSGNRFFAKYLGGTTTSGSQATNNTQSQATTTTTNPNPSTDSVDKVAKDIQVFCLDFMPELSPRTLNEMHYQQNVDKFICNYLELIGCDDEIIKTASQKMRSAEFRELISKWKKLPTTHGRFNNRLVIKYGPAGTGKTTSAEKQYGIFDPNIVDENGKPICINKTAASASQDPIELFTKFDPTIKDYVLTPIAEAMQNGTTLIIDEVNFYCEEVLSMLQTITDNTKGIIDPNSKKFLTIKDGFRLVCTMNLHTNLMGTRSLHEPLVSRAYSLENYGDKLDLSWVL